MKQELARVKQELDAEKKRYEIKKKEIARQNARTLEDHRRHIEKEINAKTIAQERLVNMTDQDIKREMAKRDLDAKQD